jgi:protein-L-isoaspartate(D-aspartate) O-methyltransferase
MSRLPRAGEAEERAQFLLRMRSRGVSDLRLLRAMELTPRAVFMPQRYADISARDIALPIGCGQTSPPPSMLAAMIDALSLEEDSQTLEIGTGSGYAAALIAQMCAEVTSLERCQTLAVEAAARLSAFGLPKIHIHFADGLALNTAQVFDRVVVHALVEPPAERLTRFIAPGGALVAAIAGETPGEQRILRIARDESGALQARVAGAVRTFTPLVEGLARVL